MAPPHTTLELKIRGMDCSGCARHLESVAKRIVGVTKVATLLSDRKVVVLYDPAKTTATAIRDGIAAAGYATIAEGKEDVIETVTALPAAQASRQEQLRIENMDCPTEEALIRNKLKGFPGVTGLEFNLLQRILTISHTLPSLDSVVVALSAAGMQVGVVEQPDELPKEEKTN